MNTIVSDTAFTKLVSLLEGRLFHTQHRGQRYLTASEFMFMGHREGADQFKHIVTRNYIFVRDGKLIVPQTNKVFLRGFFDCI